MNAHHLSTCVLALGLALAACTDEARPAVNALQPTAGTKAQTPEPPRKASLEKPTEEVAAHDPLGGTSTSPAATDVDLGPIDVPAFDDLLKKAASDITSANADAEFQKLKAELNVGG